MTGGVGEEPLGTESANIVRVTEKWQTDEKGDRYSDTSAFYQFAQGDGYGNNHSDPFTALNYALLNAETNRKGRVPESIKAIIELLPVSRRLRPAMEIRLEEHARSLGVPVDVKYIR